MDNPVVGTEVNVKAILHSAFLFKNENFGTRNGSVAGR